MTTAAGLTRRDAFAALSVVVIWGLNFVVMKVGLAAFSPMLLGALRFALADPSQTGPIALFLMIALVAHLFDLRARWSTRR